MDLAPSPGNSPRAPHAWGSFTPPQQETTFPIAQWDALSGDQKKVAENIFRDLEDRANGVQRNQPPLQTLESDDSAELLNKMATLAKTIPYLQHTKKGRYYLLIESIKSFSADFILSKTRLENWEGLVNGKRTIFRESRPQGQAPEQKEEEEQYQELCKNYSKFKQNLDNLIEEAQELEKDEEITSLNVTTINISKASLKLITNVYSINLEYLNAVISDFTKQKEDLEGKITSLLNQRKEIKYIHKKFNKSFERLGHYQENGRNFYSITTFAYNQLWNTSTPKAVQPSTSAHPIKTKSPPDNLQNEKELVLNTFAKKITDAEKNIFYTPINEIKDTSDPIPLPLLAISAWIPCFPEKRAELDNTLNGKITTLLLARKKTIQELKNFQKKIKAAASTQDDPSLNDDSIEKINKNLKEISNSFVDVTSEIQKRIDLEKERLDFERKNPKLKQKKPTVPLAELQQISIYLGIPEKKLKENVTTFQLTTEHFANRLEILISNKTQLDDEVWQTNRELDRLNHRDFCEFLKTKWEIQSKPLPKEIDYLLLNYRIKSLLKELKAYAKDGGTTEGPNRTEGFKELKAYAEDGDTTEGPNKIEGFKEWKEKIAGFTSPKKIGELFTTHIESARKTLEEINKSYSTFCIGKYKELLAEKENLLLEIKSKVDECEFKDTCEASLLLVSNCNDSISPESLKTHVKRYHERINKLKEKQKKLADAETLIKKTEESFKSEYAKLNYMLLNKTPRLPRLGSVPEECYPNPVLCKEKSIRLNLFSKDETEYKKQFIELLPTKHKQTLLTVLQKEYKRKILDPSDPEFKTKLEFITKLNVLLCAENIFSEAWIKDFISKAYIPLENQQKALDDFNLCQSTKSLSDEIITVNQKISPILILWKEFWENANQLRISGNGANQAICVRQKRLIPLIEMKSQEIKKEFREYVEGNSTKITPALRGYIEAEEDLPSDSPFINYQLHKQNAICFYQAITTLYIFKIAKAYSELKNKLTKRIETAAKKDGVTPTSIKIISLAHDDIDADALKSRIDEYLKTKIFEKSLAKLEKNYRLFKESNEQIIYPFDYFSYQQKYGYENDYPTSATFMAMHSAGWHNYMDRGEVTEPFKIPTAGLIEYGFVFPDDEVTPEQYGTGYNTFTDNEQEHVLTSHSDEAEGVKTLALPTYPSETPPVPFKKCCDEGQSCNQCGSDWW